MYRTHWLVRNIRSKRRRKKIQEIGVKKERAEKEGKADVKLHKNLKKEAERKDN